MEQQRDFWPIHESNHEGNGDAVIYTHPKFSYNANIGELKFTDGTCRSLTKRERQVFQPLVTHQNRLVKIDEFVDILSSGNQRKPENYVRVYVNRLRDKISQNPAETDEILRTVWGLGYILVNENLPIEAVPDVPGSSNFQLSISSHHEDTVRTFLNSLETRYEFRKLEPGVELVLRDLVLKNDVSTNADTYHQIITSGEFSFDPNALEAYVGGAGVHLTYNEAQHLYLLLQNAGKYVSNKKLIDEFGKMGYQVNNESLRNVFSRLRVKLRDAGLPDRIVNKFKVGYKFENSQ